MNAWRLGLAFLMCLVLSGCSGGAQTVVPAVTTQAAGAVQRRPIDRMDAVFVPAGEFVMGSTNEMRKYAMSLCRESSGRVAVAACGSAAFADEAPVHRVKLDAFWIDRTEVSNRQYRECVEAGACDQPRLDSSFSREHYYDDPAYQDFPVVNVDWNMAARYCLWAGARLPTEAEWEYAARGPESRIFPWGSVFDKSKLNYCDANCGGWADSSYDDGYPDTAPVGAFPLGASWIGALDMAGNVREWVGDWLGSYPTGDVENPTGPQTAELKIPRGGSWYDTPDDVRSTNRGGEFPDYFRHNLGFRCANDPE